MEKEMGNMERKFLKNVYDFEEQVAFDKFSCMIELKRNAKLNNDIRKKEEQIIAEFNEKITKDWNMRISTMILPMIVKAKKETIVDIFNYIQQKMLSTGELSVYELKTLPELKTIRDKRDLYNSPLL